MRFGFVAVLIGTVSWSSMASAESLNDALAAAYSNNPTIRAARAQVRALDEGVSQAKSGYRPSIEATGSVARVNSQQTVNFAGFPTERNDTYTSKNASVALVQPLFSGFKTVNGVRQAKNEVNAGRAQLTETEQQVLLAAATAYMDVIRDEAILELNRNNVQVLTRQLEASKDRFRVGEITRTDVAQSEARLARAVSDRTKAEGALAVSRAAYNRVVGQMPGSLTAPKEVNSVPATEQAALEIALQDSPALNAARYNDKAASNAVAVAKGGFLPELSLRAEYSRGWDQSSFVSDGETKQIMAQLTIPIYQAGVQSSAVRQARQINSQRRLQVTEAQRQVTEAVRNAWEALAEAEARITSDKSQVRANEIALDGVRQEAEVGSRTTLDVLNAEQELLNSRVSLTGSQHDRAVAKFQLLAAIGRLTARNLNLPVTYYDPKRNYDNVDDKIFGWSIEDEKAPSSADR